MPSFIKLLLTLLCVLSLSACGGGGGDGQESNADISKGDVFTPSLKIESSTVVTPTVVSPAFGELDLTDIESVENFRMPEDIQ
ncbi:hypothetical protein, partial [Oleiphilus sp. HI0043]